ncbi:NRAMP family divalent metal transporter [Chryseosolibacter indicus]|uniref:Divalent metal cation transporter n=1 Tax=Chryseosolibacter indicus TaxID=2782351 RepID=A0ABS5VWL1_9BACT|nr:NRAMP family divalent metal transporter [Chryseosolibacter indicus]MBT1704386.1 divalent metal cation transporter [Chryseosolibacter indicus]
MSLSNISKQHTSALLGAAFLMATSAIGPGFITQTTVFTEKLKTSFAFVILCSILLDIVVQLNIWRVLTVSGKRGQELADDVLKGSGGVLTFFIVLGGLAFNIGNLAGAGLGIQVITGIDLKLAVLISTVISLIVFWSKEAGKAIDLFAKVLGIGMILLTAYIAVSSNPPVSQAIEHSFFPEVIDTTAIMVLVGGTVGGYISFAGAHRLIDAKITGAENIKYVSNASVKAILLASVMRVLLFLAALGVVAGGATLDPANPAASVFNIAAGNVGYLIFGVVLWSASITSVVGSAYTSVSFLKSIHPFFENRYRVVITTFIIISATVFLLVGKPINVLVIAGALNAIVLPLALIIILIASRKPFLIGDYKHSLWLTVFGWIVAIILSLISIKTIFYEFVK